MHKVTLVDCIKQIIAINKDLNDQDKRSTDQMIYIVQLRDRIEKLERSINAKEKSKISWRR